MIEELREFGSLSRPAGSLRLEIIGVDVCETVAQIVGRPYTPPRHTVNSIIQSDQWSFGRENGFDADE
jgi:hypothetical protein